MATGRSPSPDPTPTDHRRPQNPTPTLLPLEDQTPKQDTAPAMDEPESKPEFLDICLDADTTEYIEKYNKYQADYVRRLKAKYFSKKAFNGGNIFDKETNIDDEIIKSSRWPCTRSFADPVQSLEDASSLPHSAAAAETSTIPGRKHHLKKSN